MIEKKLNEVLDKTEASGKRIETPTQDDLLKMIEEKHLGSSVFTHSFDVKQRDIFAQCNYCILLLSGL